MPPGQSLMTAGRGDPRTSEKSARNGRDFRPCDRGRPDKRAKGKARSREKAVDKSGLAHPEPRRVRDRDHVRFVSRRPCLICGRQPSDAHHLRFSQSRALGRKVSDEFTVPLCRGHHRELHRCGNEAAWWSNAGVDPLAYARTLWLETHPLAHMPTATTARPQAATTDP